MYRDSYKDPVVKYYDESLGISGKVEIEWYKKKVEEFGGPILDIACGTGRISLIFAERGYSITSLDNSDAMLTLFRSKIEKKPELKHLISIHNIPMQNFYFKKNFNTILCIDAFFHNLSIPHEKECLKCVADHLNPEGRFFFNVHNFNTNFIEKCRISKGKIWTERKRYWIRDNSEQIIIEQSLDLDELNQIIITFLRFKRYNNKGELLSLENSKWYSHYRKLDHYRKIIDDTGLEVEEVVGSYKNGPINENSQLIFQIKRKN